MALTLVSILIAAIPVAYCYPTAFEDLQESSSKYHFTFMISGERLHIIYVWCSLTANRTSIKFLALGDWGGVPYPPYITAVQKATAREMSKVAEQMGADFILALGDNFYYKGVNSVDSPRFQVSWVNLMSSEISLKKQKNFTPILARAGPDYGSKNPDFSSWIFYQNTFEDVYTAKSLRIPWYVLAGNHDHAGNVKAQIEYSHRSDIW